MGALLPCFRLQHHLVDHPQVENAAPRAAVQLEMDLSRCMAMPNYLLNTAEPTAHIPWRLAISLLRPWVDATEDRPIIALQAGIGVVGTWREELRHLGAQRTAPDLDTSHNNRHNILY